MKVKSDDLSGLSLLISVFSVYAFLFCLEVITHPYKEVDLHFFPLLFLLLAAFLADRGLVKHRANMTFFVGLQILFLAGGSRLFFYCLSMDPQKAGSRIFFCLFYAFLFLFAAYISYFPVGMPVVLGCFDVMALLVMITLALSRQEEASLLLRTCEICLLAMLLSLATLIRIRTEQIAERGGIIGSSFAGKAVLLLFLLLLAGLALLFAVISKNGSYLAGKATGDVIQGGIGGFGAFLQLLYQKSEAFFIWILGFLHLKNPQAVAETADAAGSMASSVTESGKMVLPLWLKPAGIAILLFLLFFFLYRIRNFRFARGEEKVEKNERKVERSGGSRAYYRDAFVRLRSYLRFRREWRKKKNTPEGRYLLIEKRYRKRDPKPASVSAPEYLRMLAEKEENKEKAESFLQLSALLESSLYRRREEK